MTKKLKKSIFKNSDIYYDWSSAKCQWKTLYLLYDIASNCFLSIFTGMKCLAVSSNKPRYENLGKSFIWVWSFKAS